MTDENRPKPTTDDLDATLDKLTLDQIRFVVARQEHAKDKDAAEAIRVKPNTVKDWKYKGAPIDDAVRLMVGDGVVVAKKLRKRNLAKAMLVKVAGLDTEDDRLRQNVATEIIEWEMGKATQKSDVNLAGSVAVEHDIDADTITEALRILGSQDGSQGGGV